MQVREKTYQELALAESGKLLELHRGGVREKPPMSFGHNRPLRHLDRMLTQQLDPADYEVSNNASRVHHPENLYYIPDIAVIPVAYMEPFLGNEEALEVYRQPLPLVVEGWSPSTGEYDVMSKIPDYQERGDEEIWRLHFFDQTLTVWRRRPDGSYDQTMHTTGTIEPIALPGVLIDLNRLFGR